jgi:hypothetical protein
MVGKILLGSIAGAVVLMLWGFLFWTVMSFGHDMARAIDNEDAVIEALDRNIAESGGYCADHQTGRRCGQGLARLQPEGQCVTRYAVISCTD